MKLRKVIDKVNNGEDKPLNNREKAYKFFVEEKGYSPEIALGIIGNLMQESHASLKTDALGFDGTGSFGIAQWLGPRKEKLKQVRPDDFHTLEGQLEFIDWELNNTEKRAASKLKEADSIEDAALIFSKYYERPHKDYAHNNKRVSFAKKLAEDLKIDLSGNQAEQVSSGDLVRASQMQEVARDNTAVRSRVPNLATPPINPNYTPLPEVEEKKQELAEESAITETQVRNLLAQEKQATEQRFLSAFQQQNAAEQPDYTPQPAQQDLSHLYNYIDVNNYAEGGQAGCGGPGEPPCPPEITNDPNDPRLRQYRDSLDLYNKGQQMLKLAKSREGMNAGDPEAEKLEKEITRLMVEAREKEAETGIKNTGVFGFSPARYESDGSVAGNPTVGKTHVRDYLLGHGAPVFDKPTQPVKFKKREKESKVDTETRGINISQDVLSADTSGIPRPQPKYWDVEVQVNQRFGSHSTKKKVTSLEELEKLKRKQAADEKSSTGSRNKLIITPRF